MTRQHHKNARACSPRFVALAALLGGTVLACAMAAGHESATADAAHRATNPPPTSHPSDRHMSDLIRHMPALDPADISEYLSIQPMPNWPTAYTRNTLMLHGHDRLVILAGPIQHHDLPDLTNHPFIDLSLPVGLRPINSNQPTDSQLVPAPVQPAP